MFETGNGPADRRACYVCKRRGPHLASAVKPQTVSYQPGPVRTQIQSPGPSSRSHTCENNNCVCREALFDAEPEFHFASPPVGLGRGARSAVGLAGDNMIQGAKPSLDFKRVNLSELYAGANYINFPQQPNTYFISISHKRRGPGILFGEALIAK